MIYCRDDELKDDEPDPPENTKEADDTTITNDLPVTTKKGKKTKKTFADLDW